MPGSEVSTAEDDISFFFCNKEVPQIFETPLELLELTSSIEGFSDFEDLFSQKYEVRRESSVFSLRSCLNEWGEPQVDLEQLLTDIFVTNGRLLHYERVLCHFPEYLQLHFKLVSNLMNAHSVLPV